MTRFGRLPVALALVFSLAFTPALSFGAVQLSNRNIDTDGRYLATVDDYGAIDGWAGYPDSFNPAGAIGASGVTFDSGTFVFVSNTHRELLVPDTSGWKTFDFGSGSGSFASDTSLTNTVTSPITAVDTNGDGFNDTANSAFSVTGTGVNLSFTLKQSVLDGRATNSAVHELRYTITNNGTSALDLKLVRQTDADLALIGGWNDDSILVGTTVDGSKYVGQNEGGDVTLGYTLWSPDAHSYAALLVGTNDALGNPFPGGATNPSIWDAYGLPAGWVNDAGGIGVLLDGIAGPQEAGAYLQWDLQLDPGASTAVSMMLFYGSEPPLPEPSTLALGLLGLLGVGAFGRRWRRR